MTSRGARLGIALTGLLTVTSVAQAGSPSTAPTWQPLVGCWEPVIDSTTAVPESARGHILCIVPVEGSTSAVDMITVADGRIFERERVDATGTQIPIRRDACSGWQRASFSSQGQRLYLRSELACQGDLTQTSTGVISMLSLDEWMDVQSVKVGEQNAVRVLRYRQARPAAVIPTEIVTALGTPLVYSTTTARLAALAPIQPADIVDVARNVDASAVEVWLLQQKLGFKADAKNLVDLRNAGVAGSVVDVVVALSYPERFAIDVLQRQIAERPAETRALGTGVGPTTGGRLGGYYDPYYLDPLRYTRYGSRYYSPFGYAYDRYGYFYPRGRPIVIVIRDPDTGSGTPVTHGQVVKGRGYTRRSTPAATTRSSGSNTSSGSGASGESTSTGSSSGGTTSSGGSSSGTSTGRTARPKPPTT
jgi:uncharacterized membrane protein YgcG